jgi:hypothetical protein
MMMEKSGVRESGIVYNDKGRGPLDWALARCSLFGTEAVFLDCTLYPPQGERLQSVMAVTLLRADHDVGSTLFNDRRLTGEDRYVLEMRFRSFRDFDAVIPFNGLPRKLVGDVYRGDPERGGKVMVQDLTVRIDRELFWHKRELRRTSSIFFAFQEGSRIWAVPVATEPAFRTKTMALKIPERIGSKDLKFLQKGSIIQIQASDDSRHVRFRFQDSPLADNNSKKEQATHHTGIIEE